MIPCYGGPVPVEASDTCTPVTWSRTQTLPSLSSSRLVRLANAEAAAAVAPGAQHAPRRLGRLARGFHLEGPLLGYDTHDDVLDVVVDDDLGASRLKDHDELAWEVSR